MNKLKGASLPGMYFLIMLISMSIVDAAPAVTPEKARAFLGARTGKIVYLKGYDSQIYFVDFSDSTLIEHRVSTDSYCLSPMISPDGTRIVYEQTSGIWIRDLVENSPKRTLVYSRPLKVGETMEPHWWIDPKTKQEYIQYTTGIVSDHEWPPKSGNTYAQKIVANTPTDPPLLIMPFLMSAARSKNGMWGATSHHSTGLYKLYPDKLENAFYDGNNWTDFGVVLACNASISPSDDPAKQNRMLHLTSGGTSMNGKLYDNHKAILIRSWTDIDADHPFWWMGIPGDRTANDSSGNLFWDSPEWSSDENYLTATGSKDIEVIDSADLYIARINLQGESSLLKVIKGSGRNHYSHLWIKTGVMPAKIRLDSTSLAFTAFRKELTDPKPKTISISNSGDGVLPKLTLGPVPSWLEVTLSGNGTNSPTIMNTVHRDSTKPGEYQAKVTLSYGDGADSASYLVRFSYSDPILTTLKPIPSKAIVLVGDSVQLNAQGFDQGGRPISLTSEMVWTGIGSTKPLTDGWFRADSISGRKYDILGTSGSVLCTTQVIVARKYLRIDAGAEPDKAAKGWVNDQTYVIGGSIGTISDSLNLSAAKDPAPIEAIRSWRYGFVNYRFSELPNSRYHIRMHFLYTTAIPGSITLKFEGQTLIENYKILALSDSLSRTVDIREVDATVSDGDGLLIEASATTGAPALVALEIYDLGPPPVSLTTPNGKEIYHVGDTLAIKWLTDASITSCGIQISLDSGVKWLPLTKRRSVGLPDPDWQNFRFAIPDTMDGFSMITNRAIISVYDYFGTDRDRSDQVFSIQPTIAIRTASANELTGLGFTHLEGGQLHFNLKGPNLWNVSLLDLQGRALMTLPQSGTGRYRFDLGRLAPGLYRIFVQSGRQVQSRLVPWFP